MLMFVSLLIARIHLVAGTLACSLQELCFVIENSCGCGCVCIHVVTFCLDVAL